MNKDVKKSIVINADVKSVWQALTDKELIKLYMFGTETESEWEEGSAITFSGEYNGMKYKDGGVIKVYEPEKKLSYTYWSSMSGIEDIPENYALVTFSLASVDGGTELTVTQENNPTETMAENSDKHWPMTLSKIKEVVEQAS